MDNINVLKFQYVLKSGKFNYTKGRQMTIAEILKQKHGEVYSISERASVREAIDTMNKNKAGSLIVENEKSEVVGILTGRDIMTKAYPGSPELDLKVSSIMTPREKLIIGMADDTVSYVMNIMTEKRVRHLPVFDHEKLTGIVSIGDVVKTVMEQSEAEARLLREHIQNPYGINIP